MRWLAHLPKTHHLPHQSLHGKQLTIQDSIEYYEEQDRRKAAIYKKRLQNFLSKNSVSSVLQGKDSNLISKRELVERSRIEAKVNSKEMANRLIEKYEKNTDHNKKMIERDLKNQQ